MAKRRPPAAAQTRGYEYEEPRVTTTPDGLVPVDSDGQPPDVDPETLRLRKPFRLQVGDSGQEVWPAGQRLPVTSKHWQLFRRACEDARAAKRAVPTDPFAVVNPYAAEAALPLPLSG